MIAGDELAPSDIEGKLRRQYRLLGVHNVVLIAMASAGWVVEGPVFCPPA